MDRVVPVLLRDAETRIPGIWGMDIQEIARLAAEVPPLWVDELRRRGVLRQTPDGEVAGDLPGTKV